MSNIIEFRSKHDREDEHGLAGNAGFSPRAKAAALRSNAKDTLRLLADQLEIAMQHARAIEPKMRDPKTRQDFGDRIEMVQRMLDIARMKILLL